MAEAPGVPCFTLRRGEHLGTRAYGAADLHLGEVARLLAREGDWRPSANLGSRIVDPRVLDKAAVCHNQFESAECRMCVWLFVSFASRTQDLPIFFKAPTKPGHFLDRDPPLIGGPDRADLRGSPAGSHPLRRW